MEVQGSGVEHIGTLKGDCFVSNDFSYKSFHLWYLGQYYMLFSTFTLQCYML